MMKIQSSTIPSVDMVTKYSTSRVPKAETKPALSTKATAADVFTEGDICPSAELKPKFGASPAPPIPIKGPGSADVFNIAAVDTFDPTAADVFHPNAADRVGPSATDEVDSRAADMAPQTVDATSAARRKKLKMVAGQVEALFVKDLLGKMQQNVPGANAKGPYADLASDMFAQAIADSVGSRGSFGIANVLYDNLCKALDAQEAAKNARSADGLNVAG